MAYKIYPLSQEIANFNKMQRADNGAWEIAQIGVTYISPNQEGGIHGTVFRQYHGAKSNGNTITVTGITQIVHSGGQMNGNADYSGYASNGVASVYLTRIVNGIQFNQVGWTIDEGWFDYSL